MVYPDDPGHHLWRKLQESTTISEMLGGEAVLRESDRGYLEGLAEAYKNSTAWDARRQILSVTTDVACYKAIQTLIPGITPYRYAMANLHALQCGRAVPVPMKDAPRFSVNRQ